MAGWRVCPAADFRVYLEADAGWAAAGYGPDVNGISVRRFAAEGALACGLFVGTVVEFHEQLSASVVAAALLVTGPVAVRLWRPVVAAAASVAGLVWFAHTAAISAGVFAVFPVMAVGFVLWAVGSRCPVRVILGCWLVASAAWVAAVGPSAPAAHLVIGPVLIAAALLVGRAMGILRFETDTHAAETARLLRERDEHAAIAVREERRRIARELHDIIAHSVSVMGVQAGAVRSVLRPEQEREAQALRQVEHTGREAVTELQRLLGLLRDTDDDTALPAVALRRVDQLVDDFRRAGLDVTLSTSGVLERVPPGLDAAAYRIVQEALTNVLKHARHAQTHVEVISQADRLWVSVVDRGDAAEPVSTAPGLGRGLYGIRERAALYGGHADIGPDAEGGYHVVVDFPIGGLG